MRVKEEKQMCTQIFIYNTVYHWAETILKLFETAMVSKKGF